MEERAIEWAQYGETVINFLGISFTLIMCLLIFILKREYKVIPFILICCFLTSQQRVVIFTIDFPMLRIAIFIGLGIVLLNNNYKLKFNKIDKIMIWYSISRIILHTILWKESSALIGEVGYCCDNLGAYMLIRYLLDDIKDIDVIIKTLILASIVVALFMLNEKLTSRNLFSIFGGVREFTMIREDKLRAQAAFAHPILAGTFGSLLFPYVWVCWHSKKKLFAIIGLICSFTIAVSSGSSGPILTLMSCFMGIFFWRLKKNMKKIRLIAIISLIIIHFSMKAPVWHLIARIDISGGSTGYHRYLLIDNAIRRFPEWFLFGLKNTAHWGWGLQDVTNMYILEGVNAGFLTMFLFIYIIILCFKAVGYAMDALENNIEAQRLVWALGVILFAHVVSFIGVSYFGYIKFFYFSLIAMIASLYNFKTITKSNEFAVNT